MPREKGKEQKEAEEKMWRDERYAGEGQEGRERVIMRED